MHYAPEGSRGGPDSRRGEATACVCRQQKRQRKAAQCAQDRAGGERLGEGLGGRSDVAPEASLGAACMPLGGVQWAGRSFASGGGEPVQEVGALRR
eukprot:2343102-Rhodomonas_salina.2